MSNCLPLLIRIVILLPLRLVLCFFLVLAIFVRALFEFGVQLCGNFSNDKNVNTGKKILITGGRSPFTLALIRYFHNAGHEVHVAETRYIKPIFLSVFSWAVHKHHTLNVIPNQQPILFATSLAQICLREGIDLLVPTCEEIFWISKGKDIIVRDSPKTRVFVEDLDVMRSLHNKWLFNQQLSNSTPTEKDSNSKFSQCNTELLRDINQVIQYVDKILQDHENASLDDRIDIVLKPVYSRFANQTIVRPTIQELIQFKKLLRNENRYSHMYSRKKFQTEWIVQEFIHGDLICTYSIANNGHLLAHGAYLGGEFTNSGYKEGGSISFEKVLDRDVYEWVKNFVAQRRFSGQIAFDMIRSKHDGKLYAIECNPRGTSGIHLFHKRVKEFTDCFFEDNCETVLLDETDNDTQLTSGMIIWCIFLFHSIENWSKLWKWCSTTWKCRDVMFEFWDPIPWLTSFIVVIEPLWRSFYYKIAYVDTFTYDIEWHGE